MRLDRAATTISDPLARLRFLRTYAKARKRRKLGALSAFRRLLLVAPLVLIVGSFRSPTPVPVVQAHPRIAPAADLRPAAHVSPEQVRSEEVWLVEKSAGSETWSNGLRIDDRFLVATHPRSWLAFPVDGSQPVRRTSLAGIVFHATESPQAPFEAEENPALKRIGESLLEYVRRRHAYNFVVDRFGRVYRVVAEDEAADHSGYSAWADANWFYINLNESFLGVAFEAISPGDLAPAQVRSAAMLIEMLRHRYEIPASNYVTHAQVSVNPANMRAGLHVDWASGFPFEAMGLANNYTEPAPALWGLGFDYDAHFTAKAASPLRDGIGDAKAILARKAAAAGLTTAAYKSRLRERYREMLALMRR